jgi:hypothetical protein
VKTRAGKSPEVPVDFGSNPEELGLMLEAGLRHADTGQGLDRTISMTRAQTSALSGLQRSRLHQSGSLDDTGESSIA